MAEQGLSPADMDNSLLTQTLVESFKALADEVQSLIDRKTILEHKLVWAHEQYQYLVDKYAPTAPDISETLAKLQLPPEIHHPSIINTTFVPLPRRGQSDSTQAELAVVIREGRKAAQQLSALTDAAKASGGSTGETSSTNMTSVSTALEQDFTVEGKKGNLGCPFSRTMPGPPNEVSEVDGTDPAATTKHTPYDDGDPICAAMYEENLSAPPPDSNGSAPKCPIRFMDKHSPEEIADYVEKHKHEIPRSHEVCVRRYQRNEEQIRKLDAKYGNLVTMIKDLSQLHAPMLPANTEDDAVDTAGAEKTSNERVENWAHAVSASVADDPEDADDEKEENDDDLERESHFARPLKEVRVGESPSRPWGISVPVYEPVSNADLKDERPVSPPAAPVRMPSPEQTPKVAQPRPSKCPFDHTKLAAMTAAMNAHTPPHPPKAPGGPSGDVKEEVLRPFTPIKQRAPQPNPVPQPTFINQPEPSKTTASGVPQMVFNGPVFIGYPIEQAIQFMQHFQNQQQ